MKKLNFVIFMILLLTAINSGQSNINPPAAQKRFIDLAESINLTLKNNSSKSIPLIIPGIMNPNLSPFSESGVRLKMGQDVYFKIKRKKYLLFTVDDKFRNGQTIIVNKLIKQRKAEILNEQ